MRVRDSYCGAWLLCIGLIVAPMSVAVAQPPSDSPPALPPTPPAASAAPANPTTGVIPPAAIAPAPVDSVPKTSPAVITPSNYPAIQYLKNRAGELVPVLKGAEFEGYLKYLESLRAPPPNNVENWSISRLSFEGHAGPEFAELTTRIELQILEGSRTIFVPLKMVEGTLRDEEHQGAGPCGLWKNDPEQGQIWWFRGAGKYELKLVQLVPIRTKDLPNRRLQLTLPPSTVSDLKLRIPSPSIRTSTEDRAARMQVVSQDGESTIELFGLGQKLDLSWQPVPSQSALNPTFHSRTAMNILIDGQSVLLEANQRIEPLQGELTEVTVKLPAGMDLVKLEGTRYKEHRIESQNQSVVRVLFERDERNPASPVDLKWLLRSRIAPDQTRILLGGFEVENGRIQSGIAVIRVSGAYRTQRIEAQDRNIVRESLAGLDRQTSPPLPGAGDPSNIVGVYRILEQPFQLALNLEKIDPYVSSEQPQYVAHFSGNAIELEATFTLQVARGSVEEFMLDWPDWKSSGWTIDSCIVRKISDRPEPEEERQYDITLDTSSEDVVDVQAAEPVIGHLQIRVQAHRPVTSSVEETQLQFPELRNARAENGVLLATLADNLDAQVRPTGTTTIRPLDPPQISSELLTRQQDRRRMAYLLNNFQSGLAVKTTVKPPSLTIESMATISSSDRGLAIDQELNYSIAYQRFSQLMVWVPTSWLEHCEYRLSTGEQLKPVTTQLQEPGYQQIRLPLEKSRTGSLQLIIRTQVGTAELSRSDEVVIPLARPTEDRLSRSRLQIRNLTGVELSIEDDKWTRESGNDAAPLWASPTLASQVRTKVKFLTETPLSGLIVSRAWIRTVVDGLGQEYTAARLRISGIRNSLRFTLPPQSELIKVQFRGKPVSPTRLVDAPTTYEIVLTEPLEPTSGNEDIFECEYSVAISPQGGFLHQIRYQPLQVGSASVWHDLLWELVLPPDEHLLQSPRQLNPLYRWERHGAIWSRTNPDSTILLTDGFLPGSFENSGNPLAGWNKYCFSRFGSVPDIQFTTIRRHLIVAIGAGCALGFSILLMNLPILRHVLVLWGAGMVLAILSIWYSEPVMLFLQPAVIGFVLALISSIFQLWWKGRFSRRIVGHTSELRRNSGIAPYRSSNSSPPASNPPSTSIRSGAPVSHSGISP